MLWYLVTFVFLSQLQFHYLVFLPVMEHACTLNLSKQLHLYGFGLAQSITNPHLTQNLGFSIPFPPL